MAALEAADDAESAADPYVRAVLSEIAADERNHAELAFRFVRWALARGGATVARDLEQLIAHELLAGAPGDWRSQLTSQVVVPCLRALLEQPALGPQHAEDLHIDVSVASRQVGELEHLGNVERRADPSDARACLVAITEIGGDTVLAVREQQRQVTRAALSEWDSEELRAFVAALRRFGDDMTRGVLDVDNNA